MFLDYFHIFLNFVAARGVRGRGRPCARIRRSLMMSVVPANFVQASTLSKNDVVASNCCRAPVCCSGGRCCPELAQHRRCWQCRRRWCGSEVNPGFSQGCRQADVAAVTLCSRVQAFQDPRVHRTVCERLSLGLAHVCVYPTEALCCRRGLGRPRYVPRINTRHISIPFKLKFELAPPPFHSNAF